MPAPILLQAFIFACLITLPTWPVLIIHYIHSYPKPSWKSLEPFLLVVSCWFGLSFFVLAFSLATEAKDDAQGNTDDSTRTGLTGAPELAPHAVDRVEKILPWTHRTDLSLSVIAGLALLGVLVRFVVAWVRYWLARRKKRRKRREARSEKKKALRERLDVDEMAEVKVEVCTRVRSLSV